MRFSLFLTLFLGFSVLVAQERQPIVQLSDEVPAIYALQNATLFLTPEKRMDNATIVVKEGIIAAIGTDIEIPKEAIVRNMKGAYIYPAWIDAYTQTKEVSGRGGGEDGFPQYKSTRSQAYYWNDAINAHIKMKDASDNVPGNSADLRSMGFGLLNVVPNDGIFRGTGVLMLAGEGKPRKDLFSEESSATFSFQKGSSAQAYPNSLMGSIALIKQALLDAEHYEKSQEILKKNLNQTPLPISLTFNAFNQQKKANLPFIFETKSWQHTLAAQEIAEEFDVKWVYKTVGDEYKCLDLCKKMKTAFIVPLSFPKPYNVKNVTEGREVSLQKMRDWEQSPMNPGLLAQNKVLFAITADGTKPSDFMANLQKAIQYGLSETDALKALTTNPAQILGIEKQVGTLEKGKIANFIISSNNIFLKDSKIYEVHILGKKYIVNAIPEYDMQGNYAFSLLNKNYKLRIKGEMTRSHVDTMKLLLANLQLPAHSLQQSGEIFLENDTTSLKMSDFSVSKNQLTFTFKTKEKQTWVYNGIYDKDGFFGTITDSNAINSPLNIAFVSPYKPETKKNDKKKDDKKIDLATLSPITFPNKSYGWEKEPEAQTLLIQGATIWTNTEKGITKNADVLVENGKISAIGENLSVPKGARIIDGKGKHLSPGIIDEHSHIAILDGVNEYSHAVTAEVRIGDALDCEDINIYRQLSGGVTAAQLLHGSANPIGGQSQIIKLRWGASPEDMKFKEAPGFIKFALGENVKQSNAGDNMRSRYPQTRMGVEQMIEDVFLAAKDYRNKQEEWEKNGKSKHLIPPKKDLQLETLLEILEGKRYITCHSYVQSEITMLMRLAERTGFKINTFTHILEGYKIADKMKAHGVNASTFADWWGYKYEVMEATPYNAALMTQQGLNVCVNSDDAEMGRRLNQEAAKGIKYGGMSEEDALKMVTLNPAKALHIDKYVGSIEKGKQADLVLWSDNPLSVYAKALYTFIDGKCYFDYEKDLAMRENIQKERTRLLLKMTTSEGDKQDASQGKKEQKLYHCDTVE